MTQPHIPLQVMPAALPPYQPKSYPLPADLVPTTSTMPKVRRMTSPTRRPVLPPIDDKTDSYYRRFISMPPIAHRLPAPVTPHMILANMTEEQTQNRLFRHAIEELTRAGYPMPKTLADRPRLVELIPRAVVDDGSAGVDGMLAENLLAAVAIFNQAGHSGASAPYAMKMLELILSWRTLTPITNHPDEWYMHSQSDGMPDFWQNTRQGEAMTEDPTFNTYYLLGDRTWFGRTIYKVLSRRLRTWLQTSPYLIYKKHTSSPHPIYPIAGATTASTPIIKRGPRHIRPVN